ncbi:Leucine-rich repeat [Cinara cedri]|uniref:Leucine-rich repeat n=1 Tax=Cinara cedri TaxID=506608 RepID=A0A5E4MI89_9HEMI|nr:Leucine-rich repeat [Cinara cedri]
MSKSKETPSSSGENNKHNDEVLPDFWNKMSTNITKLSLYNFNVDQQFLNHLSKYLQTEECVINELVFDRINLSNMNYLCCLTSNNKVNKLRLRLCQLKDKGVDDLLSILDETNGKTQLKLLYLDCNGITCKGAKRIAKVLRTNRTLESLSLAKNMIKDEGALALVNVLSTFHLTDDETKWKCMHKQHRSRILEYLIDLITQQSREKQRNMSDNTINDMEILSIEDEQLKQKVESMIVSQSHIYLTEKLLKSGSRFYCPGNFKIANLNISYNRFGVNVLNVIEQILQYQQKVCLVEEGIRHIKIEGFETDQKETIYKLIKRKKMQHE